MEKTLVPNSQLGLQEIVKVSIERARVDGGWTAPQDLCVEDLITNSGRVYLAKRITGGDTVASAMAYMAVGTSGTTAALGDTALGGEVARKALAVASATTNNVFTAVATFGGAAESIAGVALEEAGIFNHASSAQGTLFQRVTFSTVTLQNSDLLKLTLETNVGSNTI